MSAVLKTWRTPAVILACGCLISILGFGPNQPESLTGGSQ